MAGSTRASWSVPPADLPFVASPPGSVESVTASAVAAAQRWRLPPPRLVRLGMNGIFACGEEVLLRVSRPTAPPATAVELAGVLRRHGIRVPQYLHEEPLTIGQHAVFAVRRIVADGTPDWVEIGRMVARLHTLDPASVPAGFPAPFGGDFPWWRFAEMLEDVGPDIDDAPRRALEVAVQRDLPLVEAARRGPTVVCHGDVHPGNVIQSSDGPVLLDWDLVCRGPRAWDHAALTTWSSRWNGEPQLYESFAEGYGASLLGDPLAEALSELRLVAATLMRVRAGRTDPAAAAEAASRLRYWRGELNPPQWTPQ